MDGAYLLVIDNSPDHVQVIKSTLRNAGLAVWVIGGSKASEIESVLKEKAPFLLLTGPTLPPDLSMADILEMADPFPVSVASMLNAGDTVVLESAPTTRSVHVIHAGDDNQLIDLVEQTMSDAKSARKHDKLQHKLMDLQYRYDLLLDNAGDSIAYIHEGLHVYANRAYLDLLQVQDHDDISGLSLLDLMTSSEKIDLKKHLRNMSQGIFSPDSLAVSINTPGGKHVQADLTFLPTRFNDEQCIQMTVADQDAELTLRQELDHLRTTDPLTQMNNQSTFVATLSALIEKDREVDSPTAVLYVETDGIDELQQQLGITGLNAYIMDLASVINGSLEEADIAARFSDYGFAILIKRSDKSALQETGHAIISNYSSHIIELGDQTLTASCSVGMTSPGFFTHDAHELIDQARTAFREASDRGNALARYKPALSTVKSSEADREWVERIRYALNNDDFYTTQQSIINLEGENGELFENLSLMREQDHDTPASDFMRAAERNDLGSTIDRHIIPQLLLAIAATSDTHIISLSGNSILDFSFPGWFRRMLKESGAETSQLILQLSAVSAESNLKPARRVIDELQASCHGFVLSDFDNERRNIQLLEHLPVSWVKLRPELAHGLSSNPKNQEIIRSVVHSVDPYDISIIAGEVQDASDLAILWQCGVKLVTGDFFDEAPQVVSQ